MSLQQYACGVNNQFILVRDKAPDRNTPTATGVRWEPGMPPPPPILMPYVHGVEAITRDPGRYVPVMPSDAHIILLSDVATGRWRPSR